MIRLSLAFALGHARSRDVERLRHRCAALGLRDDEEAVVAVAFAPGERLPEGLDWGALRPVEAPGDTSLLKLWGLAMASTRGAFVAVLDGRDELLPGWLEAFRAAVDPRILCGPVEPPETSSRTTLAAYLSEYGQFQGPLRETELEEYPGNNIVFSRELLPAEASLRDEGFWKTFHVAELERQGRFDVTVSNQLGVRFDRGYRLGGYLARRAPHGRCFGGRRLQQPDCPPRLLCLLFTPLLPALRTTRVVRRTLGKPGNGHRLWRAFVPLVWGEVAWSLGEALGYALGPGDSCERVQ